MYSSHTPAQIQMYRSLFRGVAGLIPATLRP
jgi:hypothetical protein